MSAVSQIQIPNNLLNKLRTSGPLSYFFTPNTIGVLFYDDFQNNQALLPWENFVIGAGTASVYRDSTQPFMGIGCMKILGQSTNVNIETRVRFNNPGDKIGFGFWISLANKSTQQIDFGIERRNTGNGSNNPQANGRINFNSGTSTTLQYKTSGGGGTNTTLLDLGNQGYGATGQVIGQQTYIPCQIIADFGAGKYTSLKIGKNFFDLSAQNLYQNGISGFFDQCYIVCNGFNNTTYALVSHAIITLEG